MARDFNPTTAEQVVEVVAAVSAAGRACTAVFTASLVDTSEDAARSALLMAVDLGYLANHADEFVVASPLCRFLRTTAGPSKAAIVRVALEGYEPFLLFRQRLLESDRPDIAAQHTKTVLELSATRGQVADTLISLGTYAGAVETKGAGRYTVPRVGEGADLSILAQSAGDEHAAELVVREQVGARAAEIVSPVEVIQPLAKALVHARTGEADAAVTEAGNAVESFLTEYGNRLGVVTATDHGINAKAASIASAGHLPAKLKAVASFLGHLRNAADHGIDADIGTSWAIREETGLAYVFVACGFVAACVSRERALGHSL
jgi:hypothetical protein